MVSLSLSITRTYDQCSAGGGAHAGYFSSHVGFQSLNGGVSDVGSSFLALQFDSNSVECFWYLYTEKGLVAYFFSLDGLWSMENKSKKDLYNFLI